MAKRQKETAPSRACKAKEGKASEISDESCFDRRGAVTLGECRKSYELYKSGKIITTVTNFNMKEIY